MEDARGRSEEQDVRLGKAVALEQWRAVQQAGAERDLLCRQCAELLRVLGFGGQLCLLAQRHLDAHRVGDAALKGRLRRRGSVDGEAKWRHTPYLDGLPQTQRLRPVVGGEQLDDIDVEQRVGVRLRGRVGRVPEILEQLGCGGKGGVRGRRSVRQRQDARVTKMILRPARW